MSDNSEVIVAPTASGALEHPQLQLQRLFELAVQKGPDGVAALERLVALQAQVEARDAKREFTSAMAAFKAQCPPVERRTENQQFKVTRNGGSEVRRYASLEDIERTIRPHLGANGLSYRWTDTKLDGDLLTMSCVVSHLSGHSESSAVTLPWGSSAGASAQQKMGAAMTYAQRYSLVQALGLTSCDEDVDGNAPVEYVTEAQVLELEALIDQRPAGSRARLLAYLGVGALEEIPADRFEWLKGDLEAKIKAQR